MKFHVIKHLFVVCKYLALIETKLLIIMLRWPNTNAEIGAKISKFSLGFSCPNSTGSFILLSSNQLTVSFECISLYYIFYQTTDVRHQVNLSLFLSQRQNFLSFCTSKNRFSPSFSAYKNLYVIKLILLLLLY